MHINASLIHAHHTTAQTVLRSVTSQFLLLAPAPVAAAGHNLQNHLARLLAPVARADNLDSFVLGLVARDLDLGSGLLAQVVDGAAAGADDEPMVS
jgi:hypothetical protein